MGKAVVMIKSMTAYAEHTAGAGGVSVSVEIRTYNSRFLDVTIRLPANCRHFEPFIKEWVTDSLSRGRVEVFLNMNGKPDGTNQPMFVVDRERAVACHAALEELRDTVGLSGAVPLDLVAGFDGVITQPEPEKPGEHELALVREAVLAALEGVNAMREKEGAFLADDLSRRIDLLEKNLDSIEGLSTGLVNTCFDRLKERIGAILEDMVELDEARLLQEAAIHADRCDISEEIVRARSHINQFRAAIAGKDACGRKLNFLLQELNREVNTLGSKSSDSRVSTMVVEMKAELEKIREQVQNIE